jgi:glycine/D-amino acid oxidase-like deaminating enzyme
MSADVVVIGGGTVGASIAFGLAGRGVSVVLLDGGDSDFRAATANFGLVWSQGKGMNMPAYQSLTKSSADLWRAFASEVEEASGIDLQFEQQGGLTLCLGETEFEARRAKLERLQDQLGGNSVDWEMMERPALERLLPGIMLGSEVTGASFGQRDGHANPLKLLSALHVGLLRRGGRFRGRADVKAIRKLADGCIELDLGVDRLTARKVVIAAGLGSKGLANQVGISLPIRPQRGQILVTERVQRFLPLPLHSIRQTAEGTVMIGATHEDTGYDASTTVNGASQLAQRAMRQIPALGQATLIRQWAGLRIMTPDSYPIYAQSASVPGVFVATCHSGITLAPSHAGLVADAILCGVLPAQLNPFSEARFNVPQAA